jgi:hypothetical protein
MRYSAALVVALMWGSAAPAAAAPKAELWSRWEAHDPQAATRVDHSAWDAFLREYVVADHPSGINRVRYAEVGMADTQRLEGYLERLQGVAVSELGRAEQRAYWINLYNALTVKVILAHYPVKSIREVDISPGWFADGPWRAKLLTVEGEEVSLDDVEHRILRPIWADNRIHYAVNCASLGCPNLQSEAFTAANAERLLDKGAREYVNHPRGARLDDGKLVASNIDDWFEDDFGGSKEGVLAHLRRYAEGALAEALAGFDGKVRYEYDWALNE